MVSGVDENGCFGFQALGIDPQLVAVVGIGSALEGFVFGVEDIGGLASVADDDIGDAFFLVFGVEPDVVLEGHVKGGVIVEVGLEVMADVALEEFVHVEEVGAETVVTRGAFEGEVA
jgi:glycerate-2-kinase